MLLSQAHVTDLEVQALTRAVTSGWVAPLGPEVDGFEQDICGFTGARHALALSSGTAAIHLALLGLDVKPGDEVITTPLSDMGTVAPIVQCNCIPVFADVHLGTFNLDPASVEALFAATVRAFGRVWDFDGRSAEICEINWRGP